MNYTEYYSARDKITQIVKEDLLGPVNENEVLEESPVGYYLLGKIYPRNIAQIEDEDVKLDRDEEVFHEEETIAMGNGGYPSAMGLTFAIEKETRSFDIFVSVAYYEPNEKNKKWQRKTIEKLNTIDTGELINKKRIIINLYNQLILYVSSYKSETINNYKITATIVNNNTSPNSSYVELSKLTFFQPKLIVKNPVLGKFCELFQRVTYLNDEETQELELLYHDIKNYSIGHGCATNWSFSEDGSVNEIEMQIIPEQAVLQMKPSESISGDFLSMKYLAEIDYDDLAKGIKQLCDNYKTWISKLEIELNNIDVQLKKCAKNNIAKCKSICERLSRTIELFKDKDVLRAFKYANKAMYLQRKHTVKNIKESDINWYPFQLAFFLIEIAPIVNPMCEQRKIVDLLWFPTGGGKTEAYLGIAAFTIFYRRICALNKGEKDIGVAVFMRYTLRLLSLQQFERASAMICAAEIIRKGENLGDNHFGIALWAGSALTPNTLKEADEYLHGKTANCSNPVQVKKCPWCGALLNESNYSVETTESRMYISCTNEDCDFHDELPIHLIDEDIYKHKPSFVIGTIDKFAQIAFKDEAGELLGVDLPNPPDLIIQDELHLISGPLGTITGIYEAAITKLCEKNGIKPKIIASTATIRNAENQIKALYGMDYDQFPPQGLNIKDSFFAELSSRDKKAERDYIGVFSAGTSRAVTFTRTAAAILFASRYLIDCGYSEEVIDSFWTQTGYFNTLKELGSALSRIVDAVQDRFVYLKESKFKNKYIINGTTNRYCRNYELTSRKNSNDLGNAIQNQLIIPYKKDNSTNPYDFIVASNMISVGVDVPRLNTMVVVGQPIKSSEYIQSTSRVGRRTPGLVYTIYQPVFSRDRSHYEQFNLYHSCLYKYVEASSLTPFADRARDRALQALYVILCRYFVPSLRKNEDAKNFRANLKELDIVRKYIYDYVAIVDPDELDNVKDEIKEIETEWETNAKSNTKLIYFRAYNDTNTLFKEDIKEGNRFRMMNSMRSVEPTIEVETKE